MSKKILLHRQSPSCKAGTRLGEVVGGTTAICCCCPCALANIMFLAICKVPAGLCRRALKKKRRQHVTKEGLFPPRHHPMCADETPDVKSRSLVEQDKEVMELEEEMWDRFYSTGFWRSSSQRHSSQTISSTFSNLQGY